MNGPDETTYKEEEEAKRVKFPEMYSAMQAAAIALASEQNCSGIDMIHFSVQPMRHMAQRFRQPCKEAQPPSEVVFPQR